MPIDWNKSRRNPFRPNMVIQEYAPIKVGESKASTDSVFRRLVPFMRYLVVKKARGIPKTIEKNVVKIAITIECQKARR